VKVAELQEFLRSLSQPLQSAGARGPANDLERVRAGLEPFKELAVGEFADFLVRAHRFTVEGTVPVKSKTRPKPVADAEKVRAAAQQVQSLCEQALEAGVPETTLDAEMKKLEKALSTEDLLEVVRQLALPEGTKTKKDALAAIRQKIAGRKPAPQATPEPATAEPTASGRVTTPADEALQP
jgi:hypothetical protein